MCVCVSPTKVIRIPTRRGRPATNQPVVHSSTSKVRFDRDIERRQGVKQSGLPSFGLVFQPTYPPAPPLNPPPKKTSPSTPPPPPPLNYFQEKYQARHLVIHFGGSTTAMASFRSCAFETALCLRVPLAKFPPKSGVSCRTSCSWFLRDTKRNEPPFCGVFKRRATPFGGFGEWLEPPGNLAQALEEQLAQLKKEKEDTEIEPRAALLGWAPGCPVQLGVLVGCGSKFSHQRTAGFSPWFHLPGFHFGYLFLTHSQLFRGKVDF